MSYQWKGVYQQGCQSYLFIVDIFVQYNVHEEALSGFGHDEGGMFHVQGSIRGPSFLMTKQYSTHNVSLEGTVNTNLHIIEGYWRIAGESHYRGPFTLARPAWTCCECSQALTYDHVYVCDSCIAPIWSSAYITCAVCVHTQHMRRYCIAAPGQTNKNTSASAAGSIADVDKTIDQAQQTLASGFITSAESQALGEAEVDAFVAFLPTPVKYASHFVNSHNSIATGTIDIGSLGGNIAEHGGDLLSSAGDLVISLFV